MQAGSLVPDEVVKNLLEERLEQAESALDVSRLVEAAVTGTISETVRADFLLRIADFGLPISDCGLRIAD